MLFGNFHICQSRVLELYPIKYSWMYMCRVLTVLCPLPWRQFSSNLIILLGMMVWGSSTFLVWGLLDFIYKFIYDFLHFSCNTEKFRSEWHQTHYDVRGVEILKYSTWPRASYLKKVICPDKILLVLFLLLFFLNIWYLQKQLLTKKK